MRAVTAQLELCGAEVRSDEKFSPGVGLLRHVVKEIDEADGYLLLVSSASSESNWVKLELEIADTREPNRLRILAVVLDDAPKPPIL